jgi:glycosyltransferase involved in cell wall biosynthesis
MSRIAATMPSGTCGRAYYRTHVLGDLPEFLLPLEPDYDAIQGVPRHPASDFASNHGFQAHRRRFLYSGRLAPVKRVDVTIDAFASIAKDVPNWDLVIAGTVPLLEQLESRVPDELRERVRFLGLLQQDELRCCTLSCDALVHASAWEPWGLVINEAVASGLAVIATNVTGAAADLVRDNVNGMLVPADSVESMAVAMRTMATGDTCARLRANLSRILSD